MSASPARLPALQGKLRSLAHTQGRGPRRPLRRSATNGSLRIAGDWIPAVAGMTRVR